jgi:hypothetical protein
MLPPTIWMSVNILHPSRGVIKWLGARFWSPARPATPVGRRSSNCWLGVTRSGRWPTDRTSGRRRWRPGGKASAVGNDFLFQHLREVAIDHQNGVFEGTNDLVERLGGRPPTTLEAFITKHRKAFE